MNFSVRQEFYKLKYRKIVWISPIILLVLMLTTAYTIGYNESSLLVATCYDSPDWIMLILIIVGSTTISMEFQNNAILTLIYKSSNKAYVYISKYITILYYNVFLHLIAIVFTLLLNETHINQNISLLSIYKYRQPLWENILKISMLDILTTTFIISIIFLLSCMINNNAIVISISLLVIFIGQFISSNLLNNEKFVSLLRWNPFNMTNLTRQYYNYATYFETSHLSNSKLLFGTAVYTLLFTIIGYLIFRKKHF